MDITSHYAFFASTRNSWMELFPANFCQCIVQINFKKKRNRSGTKLWPNSQKNLHRSLLRPGTRSAHCRGKTPQMYKTKFKIAIKINKNFNFCWNRSNSFRTSYWICSLLGIRSPTRKPRLSRNSLNSKYQSFEPMRGNQNLQSDSERQLAS